MRRNHFGIILLVLIGLIAASCSSDSQSSAAAAAADAADTDQTTGTGDDSQADQQAEDAATDAADDDSESDDSSDDSGDNDDPSAEFDPAAVPTGQARDFGSPPEIPTGALSAEAAQAIETLMGPRLLERIIDEASFEAIDTLGDSGDPRVAWWLADLMRVANQGDLAATLTNAIGSVLGTEIDPFSPWGEATDHLIAWDIPAPPDYLQFKRNAYLVVEPRWEDIFVESDLIDWRIVSWGGVLIDNRVYDDTDTPCNCIPAADNPITTDVAGGDEWLDDDTIIFGVSINGEHRAYPRSIMEVREMVNDTLGGRDFAMPYCTLCGSAQVFFTDEVPDGVERPILRTSGLLSRSNKVMYDVNTFSVFDTFLGKAVTGPLAELDLELAQNSVITTTWGAWKAEHPDTDVLDISLANGRPDSDLRNTRDADGPIFPIGDVDPRLPVQEDVLGLLTADGDPIAFHVKSAIAALEAGETIEVEGITLVLDAGGVKAVDADGNDLGGHQAFWFAWSQFHPDTDLWPMAQ